MIKRQGFTLLEVLIALTLFAILAAITTSSMYHAFNTRARVNEKADRLASLQLALSLIKQDTEQVAARGIQDSEHHPLPVFIGRSDYVEFTRGGLINPNGLEKRSSQQRVALRCAHHQLIRRTWPALDTPHPERFQDNVLLKHVQQCRFGFLNASLQVLPEWRGNNLSNAEAVEMFPKAIQLRLVLPDLGKGTLLFIIAEGLYKNV